MSSFLAGLPVKTEEGAIHEGSALDRYLTVRHSGLANIGIYDPSWPISGDLTEGRPVELVIVATHFQWLRYPVIAFELGRIGTWRGIVTDPRWSAQEAAYRASRPNLFHRRGKKRSWILVSTPIGHMLMNPAEIRREIGFNVVAGDILLWQDARFDLYAVV